MIFRKKKLTSLKKFLKLTRYTGLYPCLLK